MTDLRPLNGIAQVQAHNRCAWLRLLDTWGLRAVRAACTACGIPARLPDVEESLQQRFNPPDPSPDSDPTPSDRSPPATPPTQDQPMPAAAPAVDQPALLERLRAEAARRGLPLCRAYRAMGSGTSVGSLLRHGKAGPAQIAKVEAWLASAWDGMTGATQADDKALAKAVTATESKRRAHDAPFGLRTIPPAAARKALLGAAAALGVRPVTCYQVIDGRLREVQALPVGGAA